MVGVEVGDGGEGGGVDVRLSRVEDAGEQAEGEGVAVDEEVEEEDDGLGRGEGWWGGSRGRAGRSATS